MLEGYENVRAYCYNCKSAREVLVIVSVPDPYPGQHWNGHCRTRW
jgi:hypothetical protein